MEQSHLGPDMVKLLHAFNVVSVHSQGLSSSSHYFLPGQLTIAVKIYVSIFMPSLSIRFSAARVSGPSRIKSCEASLWSTLLQGLPLPYSILFKLFQRSTHEDRNRFIQLRGMGSEMEDWKGPISTSYNDPLVNLFHHLRV